MQHDQIVLFGDSITQQSWGQQQGLGAALANLYQRRFDVMNRGLSGYNSSWAIPVAEEWLPRKGDTSRPTIRLLTVWFGANDAVLPPASQSITLKQFKLNIAKIVSLIRDPSSPYHNPDTKVLLLTATPYDPTIPFPPEMLAHFKALRQEAEASGKPFVEPKREVDRTKEFAMAVKEVGEQQGVPVVDLFSAMMKAAEQNPEGMKPFLTDGLHLTNEGYRVVTQEVLQAISKHFPELQWDKVKERFPLWSECKPIEGEQ